MVEIKWTRFSDDPVDMSEYDETGYALVKVSVDVVRGLDNGMWHWYVGTYSGTYHETKEEAIAALQKYLEEQY